MKPDEKIILLLTFLTGVFAGASMYILFFAPQYKADVIEERSQLSIVGEMYGGCQRATGTCPTFRLEDNRNYYYLGQGERQNGRLPAAIANPVLAELTEYRLKSLAAAVESDSCQSYVDGVDYRYEVVFQNTRYVLDTCRTSLAFSTEFQQKLLTIWQYMENPTTTYPVIIEQGLGAWFVNRFRGE